MGETQDGDRWHRVDQLRMYRARTAVGVALVGGTLVDCNGRGRSQDQMECEVAQAAVHAG